MVHWHLRCSQDTGPRMTTGIHLSLNQMRPLERIESWVKLSITTTNLDLQVIDLFDINICTINPFIKQRHYLICIHNLHDNIEIIY